MNSGSLLPLASRHSEALAPLWRLLIDSANSDSAEEDEDSAAVPRGRRKPSKVFSGLRTARRNLTLGLLKVYVAVDDTKGVMGAPDLYKDCTRLIGHADHCIQSSSLDCLAKWNISAINRYKKELHGLISDKSFRETLTLFAVDTRLDDTMVPSHRPIVLPLLTTILYAKLTQRGGRGAAKNAMSQRRATIFAFFCAFDPLELKSLVALVLAPLAAIGATAAAAGASSDGGGDAVSLSEWRERSAALSTISATQQLGVLRSLHEAVSQLGAALPPYLSELLSSLSHLLLYSTHCACNAEGHEADEAALLLQAQHLALTSHVHSISCKQERRGYGPSSYSASYCRPSQQSTPYYHTRASSPSHAPHRYSNASQHTTHNHPPVYFLPY